MRQHRVSRDDARRCIILIMLPMSLSSSTNKLHTSIILSNHSTSSLRLVKRAAERCACTGCSSVHIISTLQRCAACVYQMVRIHLYAAAASASHAPRTCVSQLRFSLQVRARAQSRERRFFLAALPLYMCLL
jgi:hypothetical protein